ncbi:unnamed protein product [Citrullus colocynthis]|uniref:Uncharacterized protein n=1 Tax=Citrullus colocynthis TaxID=252529 RepID=A0ABP0Y7N5_9ROSI
MHSLVTTSAGYTTTYIGVVSSRSQIVINRTGYIATHIEVVSSGSQIIVDRTGDDLIGKKGGKHLNQIKIKHIQGEYRNNTRLANSLMASLQKGTHLSNLVKKVTPPST